MLKKVISGLTAALVIIMPAIASAHVIVTPSAADVGQELVFSVSVPNEQQTPVVSLRLDIPSGIMDVTPTVANGWTIQTTASTGSDPELTSVTWSGGEIPVGQREDFSFGAQVPAAATQLHWKAYQTYGDGTVVHWDQKPAGSDDSTGNAGPYSVTNITNDLTSSGTKTTASSSTATLALVFSLVALITAAGGILFRKK
jgi:uncharacterized protein YcnI